jgi:hypothetical protein
MKPVVSDKWLIISGKRNKSDNNGRRKLERCNKKRRELSERLRNEKQRGSVSSKSNDDNRRPQLKLKNGNWKKNCDVLRTGILLDLPRTMVVLLLGITVLTALMVLLLGITVLTDLRIMVVIITALHSETACLFELSTDSVTQFQQNCLMWK